MFQLAQKDVWISGHLFQNFRRSLLQHVSYDLTKSGKHGKRRSMSPFSKPHGCGSPGSTDIPWIYHQNVIFCSCTQNCKKNPLVNMVSKIGHLVWSIFPLKPSFIIKLYHHLVGCSSSPLIFPFWEPFFHWGHHRSVSFGEALRSRGSLLRLSGFTVSPKNHPNQRTSMKHVKHSETVHQSSTIQLSGNWGYLLNSNLGTKMYYITIRFGFLHVLIVIFQTNSCGKCWLKPGFTEFQTGLGGRGPVQSWLSPWCRCFSLAVDILEIEVSISDICKSQSKYVDFCNFSPDLIKIHQYITDIMDTWCG